jgi:auxin-responsive protein IAA
MELQLGLGLPSEKTMKGLDLNSYVSEPKELLGSGQLHLGSYSWFSTNDNDKKRSFIDASEESSRNEDVPRTLPLLVWNNQPNEEDDPPKDLDNHCNYSFSSNKYIPSLSLSLSRANYIVILFFILLLLLLLLLLLSFEWVVQY